MSRRDLASRFLFMVAFVIFGFFLGGFLGTKVFGSDSDMGWDQIPDMIGGTMIGSGCSILIGLFLLRHLTNRQLVRGGVAALIGTAIVLILLRMVS